VDAEQAVDQSAAGQMTVLTSNNEFDKAAVYAAGLSLASVKFVALEPKDAVTYSGEIAKPRKGNSLTSRC